MSEPRKLYTGSASGGLDQEQYEAARRRAQQLAEQNARRRTVQQPMRTAQGRHISQRPVVTGQPAPAPEPPVQETAQQAAPAPERPRELTYAQRQAMAYRAAADQRIYAVLLLAGVGLHGHLSAACACGVHFGESRRHAALQVVHRVRIEGIAILHDDALGAGDVVLAIVASRGQLAPRGVFALAIDPYFSFVHQITPIVCPAQISPV